MSRLLHLCSFRIQSRLCQTTQQSLQLASELKIKLTHAFKLATAFMDRRFRRRMPSSSPRMQSIQFLSNLLDRVRTNDKQPHLSGRDHGDPFSSKRYPPKHRSHNPHPFHPSFRSSHLSSPSKVPNQNGRGNSHHDGIHISRVRNALYRSPPIVDLHLPTSQRTHSLPNPKLYTHRHLGDLCINHGARVRIYT